MMNDLMEIIKKLEDVEDLIAERVNQGRFVNLDECDQLINLRRMIFKATVTVQNIQTTYGE